MFNELILGNLLRMTRTGSLTWLILKHHQTSKYLSFQN